MRNSVKTVMGHLASKVSPQCKYPNAIFVLAHMRCGSTALSNILCSRTDISGYGEAHIRYQDQSSLGRLVVNQALRGGWDRRATYLFDKVLHNRHDADAPDDFFQARAIFMVRQPGPAIASIRKLYQSLGRDEYGTDEEAGTYYVQRLQSLKVTYQRFPEDRRIGLTHAMLMADPDAALSRISKKLQISPGLENKYESPKASRKGGGGDPTMSGKFTRIEQSQVRSTVDPIGSLHLTDKLRSDAIESYSAFVDLIADESKA